MRDPQHHKRTAARLFQTLAADGATPPAISCRAPASSSSSSWPALLFVAAPLALGRLGRRRRRLGRGAAGRARQVRRRRRRRRPTTTRTTRPRAAATTRTRHRHRPTGHGRDRPGKVRTGERRRHRRRTSTRGKTGESAGRQDRQGDPGAKNTDRPGLDTGKSTRARPTPATRPARPSGGSVDAARAGGQAPLARQPLPRILFDGLAARLIVVSRARRRPCPRTRTLSASSTSPLPGPDESWPGSSSSEGS